MTTLSPREPDIATSSRTTSPPHVPAQRTGPGAPAAAPGFAVHEERPGRGAVVLRAVGELDAASADRLTDPVRRRLASTADTLVLDLSAVSFLDTAGAVALLEAAARAKTRDARLRVISSSAVDRVLQLIDVADEFTYADGVGEVLTATR